MKYLLDTDVIISHLKGKKVIPSQVFRQGTGISVITYGELLVGVYKSVIPEKNLVMLSSFIKEARIEILDIGKEIILDYAKIRSELEEKGKVIDGFDILIGVTAKLSTLILLTENKKHFEKIPGLKTE